MELIFWVTSAGRTAYEAYRKAPEALLDGLHLQESERLVHSKRVQKTTPVLEQDPKQRVRTAALTVCRRVAPS